MGKAKKPTAWIENPPLEKDEWKDCQRYKVKYNNTKLDGKFYNEWDIVETMVKLSQLYFEKL
jgi:hypothetical protein